MKTKFQHVVIYFWSIATSFFWRMQTNFQKNANYKFTKLAIPKITAVEVNERWGYPSLVEDLGA